MKYDYDELKKLPEDVSIIILFDFLNVLKNAKKKGGNLDDNFPPLVFWWFENKNPEVDELIKNAVNSFNWRSKWIIEDRDNNKWLLYPESLRFAEISANGSLGEFGVTNDGMVWLMRNKPEVCIQANEDLNNFKKYFRKIIEDYLREKEIK